MSGRGDGRRDRDGVHEALDEAISAALDDELPAAEAAALRARIAAEPALAARARDFEALDAALRRLAAADASTAGQARQAGVGAGVRAEVEATEAGLAALQARLEPPRRGPWRRHAPIAGVLAAAAALALWLRSVAPVPNPLAGLGAVADSGSAPAAGVEGEVAVETGGAEGDDVEVLPGVPLEDFELVDQLELLDFLVERQAEGHG